jgi:hypothetical protein
MKDRSTLRPPGVTNRHVLTVNDAHGVCQAQLTPSKENPVTPAEWIALGRQEGLVRNDDNDADRADDEPTSNDFAIARKASAAAYQASQEAGHPGATQSAAAAAHHAESDRPGAAVRHHNDAAAHESEGHRLYDDGDQEGAQSHYAAASHHRLAAEAHAPTGNRARRPILNRVDLVLNTVAAESDADPLGLPTMNYKAEGSNADSPNRGAWADAEVAGGWRGTGHYRDYYAPMGAARGRHHGEPEPRFEFPIEEVEGDSQAKGQGGVYGKPPSTTRSAMDLLPLPQEQYGEEPTDEEFGSSDAIASKAVRGGKAMGIGRGNRKPREDGRGMSEVRPTGRAAMFGGQYEDDHVRSFGRNAHQVHNEQSVTDDGLPLPQTFATPVYRR